MKIEGNERTIAEQIVAMREAGPVNDSQSAPEEKRFSVAEATPLLGHTPDIHMDDLAG